MPGFSNLEPRVQSLEDTRRTSLGFVSSVHLSDLPLVATQVIAAGAGPFIDNLWGGLQEQFPIGVAEIRVGTLGTATVVRVYEELEGKICVQSQVEFQDQSAGATTWTLSAVSGVDLDLTPGDPNAGVITRITAIGGTSNQNENTDAAFLNVATIRPFPGFDGTRRYIDLAFQIEHNDGGPRTIQLVQSYGDLVVIATAE